MNSFRETTAFRITIDEIFRGLITGEKTGSVIYGADLDRNEQYAYQAGELAYQATDKVEPAVLAMVLNARLGSAKTRVFDRLVHLGVEDADINAILYKNGKLINYRMLWDKEISETLLKDFPEMPFASQVAVLAHTIILLDRINDPSEPAPASIRETVLQTGHSLRALAERSGTSLAIELGTALSKLEPNRVNPINNVNALDIHTPR